MEKQPLKGEGEGDTTAPLSKEEVESNKRFASFRTALKLCVPYASSIGGTGTLIGCGPNIVLKGQLEVWVDFPDLKSSVLASWKLILKFVLLSRLYSSSSINFTSWLVIGFPAMVVDLILAWIFILIIFFGFKDTFGLRKQTEEDKDETANQVIKAEYVKLGGITLVFFSRPCLWWSCDISILYGLSLMVSHLFQLLFCKRFVFLG